MKHKLERERSRPCRAADKTTAPNFCYDFVSCLHNNEAAIKVGASNLTLLAWKEQPGFKTGNLHVAQIL